MLMLFLKVENGMERTVVTIVGNSRGSLPKSAEDRAVALLRRLGAEILAVDTLCLERGVDIILSGRSDALVNAARKTLQQLASFDIFVQPLDNFRKKKLLVADMDATIIQGESLDDLAEHLGIKDKIAPITAQAMRGEIDFPEALRQRVLLLKGLPLSALFETVSKVRFSQGAETLVKTMNRFGVKCVLVSGGFEQFTQAVGDRLGFWRNFGNRLEVSNGALTGAVLPPILDKHAKVQTLREMANVLNLAPAAVLAIGDGANDIPMLQAAGTGVGYFGKPAVQEATPFQIRRTDLVSLLYMQGYTADDILSN